MFFIETQVSDTSLWASCLFIAHETVIYVTLNGMNEVNWSRLDMLPCVTNKGNNSYANSEMVTDRKLFSYVQLLNSDPSENRICPCQSEGRPVFTSFTVLYFKKNDVTENIKNTNTMKLTWCFPITLSITSEGYL